MTDLPDENFHSTLLYSVIEFHVLNYYKIKVLFELMLDEHTHANGTEVRPALLQTVFVRQQHIAHPR